MNFMTAMTNTPGELHTVLLKKIFYHAVTIYKLIPPRCMFKCSAQATRCQSGYMKIQPQSCTLIHEVSFLTLISLVT